MAFGSFDEAGVTQPMAEINTTPLVDVMLVLLVIFIITAPLFHQAVPIDLPQVTANKLDDKPEVIHLRADRKVQYEKVADVMAAAQRANIVKIAFLTQPNP